MTPVARQAGRVETSGAKYALTKAKIEGSPEIAPEAAHPHAGESGVGSNAGPICIARPDQRATCRAASDGREIGRNHSAAAGIRRFAKPSSRRKHAFREIVPQRFVANLGRLVPRTVARNDELPARFAFDDHPELSPPRCRRECAYRASGPSGCNRLLLRHCWGWHHLAPLLPQLQMSALRASILLAAPPQSNWFLCKLRTKCRQRR